MKRLRYFKNEYVKNDNDLLYVCSIPIKIAKTVNIIYRKVYISRFSILHIIERRVGIAYFVLDLIPSIIKNPDKIVDNSNKRLDSFLFIKYKINKAYGVVIEQTKKPDKNRVISAFPIDNKTYNKLQDISGRAACPPLKSV